jgi:hypothetical protein
MNPESGDPETRLPGGRSQVFRRGSIVFRNAEPWSRTVHALLRHLADVGFSAAPRLVGTGFDTEGRETLSYVEGESVHPGPWSDEGVIGVGAMLRALHEACRSFSPPADAVWRPWFGRDLGGPRFVIGHCDAGPWNIIARDGLPIALIDWEAAGPVNPRIELAQACWLNAQLHDDDVAERVGLPSAAARARQVRLLVDGYGLSSAERYGLVDTIIELAVRDAANEAIEARVTPDSRDVSSLWAVAWRTRSAAWMMRHRVSLENALA